MFLDQICEDIPQVLDSDVPGLPERPINIFLHRLFQVLSSFILSYISIFYLFIGTTTQLAISCSIVYLEPLSSFNISLYLLS